MIKNELNLFSLNSFYCQSSKGCDDSEKDRLIECKADFLPLEIMYPFILIAFSETAHVSREKLSGHINSCTFQVQITNVLGFLSRSDFCG